MKKPNKILLFAAGGLAFLAVLWKGFGSLRARSLSSPTGRINLAAYNPDKGLWVLALDGGGNIAGIFIGGDVYINTGFGGGKYPVSKLGSLSKIGKAGLEDYIRATAARFLRVQIDGVVVSDAVFNLDDLKNIVLKSNMPIYDKIVVWRRIAESVITPRSIIDLGDTRAVVDVKQPDGVVLKEADSELFPLEAGQIFVENELAKEGLKVIVVNQAKTPFLAKLAADIIENSGIDVVRRETGSSLRKNCVLRAREGLRKSLSARRIAGMFNCEVGARVPEFNQADIEVEIGSDFSRKMFGDK